MPDLENDIVAFRRDQVTLETYHKGKWVIYHDGTRIDAFDTFEAAATEAVRRFGRGPYLIRQVGAPEFVMPASVAFRLA